MTKLNRDKINKKMDEEQRNSDIKSFLREKANSQLGMKNSQTPGDVKTHPAIEKFLTLNPKSRVSQSIKRQYYELVQSNDKSTGKESE